MKNRRKTTRVSYERPITLKGTRGSAQCMLHNVSLKGAYVTTRRRVGLRVRDTVRFSIVLSSGKARISVSGKARIMHKTNTGGMGLYFLEMSDDALTALRAIIANTLGDGDKVQNELKQLICRL